MYKWFLYSPTVKGMQSFGKGVYANKQSWSAIDHGIAIPYTGKKEHGRFHRKPRHIGVYKEMDNEYDYNFKLIKKPPNNWDDINRSNWCEKNWKYYRKHQWK